MHELSIAQSIVDLAEEQARNHQAQCIEELELEIGSLAGVEWQALEFALASCVKGTMLENARIVRHVIPGEGRCGDCETVFSTNTLFYPCPACGSYAAKIVRGKELRIKSIVVK
jgi:hydrogenase nickel incorporation protein HypA/HybF